MRFRFTARATSTRGNARLNRQHHGAACQRHRRQAENGTRARPAGHGHAGRRQDRLGDWTLVGNALRHVPRGSFFHPGGEIVLHAASKPETREVAIEVTDDGPGIPSDKVALLFQPAPYQRRIGYALILAREIALAHGGDMEVESTRGPPHAWDDGPPRASGSLNV